MQTTRKKDELRDILIDHPPQDFGSRLAMGIEAYIAGLEQKKQAKAWQELPYLVQFGPTLVTWGSKMPNITWVNPGIKHGGLTEYNKEHIDNKIPNAYKLTTYDLGDDNMPTIEEVTRIFSEGSMKFPVMKKAKRGERGVGIYYINDHDTLKKHWRAMKQCIIEREPSVLQEYCSLQKEYCLQFYKQLDATGNTTTQFGGLSLRNIPHVVGDGKSSVLELIAGLEISEQHKENILQKLKESEPSTLTKIPDQDNHTTIVRTASIDFGTIYETIHLSSEQKTQIVTLLEQLTAGFSQDFLNVGRFDLKAHSLEDLLVGNCKVIECNGGGGIPTIVYDEGLSIQEKYDILNKHFTLLNTIAEQNKQKKHGLGSSNMFIWPTVLHASLKSIRKKGISFTKLSSNKKNKRIVTLYKEILHFLFGCKKERIKKTISTLLVS